MNATPDDSRTHPHDVPAERCSRRDGARAGDDPRDRDAPDDRDSRLGAAQLAAPSTRRWRRSARFDSTS